MFPHLRRHHGRSMTDPLDDIFHWAAFVAFIEVANATKGWPDSEQVRRRAYSLYEAELAKKSATPTNEEV